MRKNGGAPIWFIADHLGSTSLATDASGNLVARQLYDAWGNVRSGGSMPTDIGYTGQRFDTYIKLVQMGARWYDPEIGRWLSPDTIVPDPKNPQSLNRLSYVRNNPVIRIDPTGHIDCLKNPKACGEEDPAKKPRKPPQPPGQTSWWLDPYDRKTLEGYWQQQVGPNDCGPTSMAMAINLRMRMPWQPVQGKEFGDVLMDAANNGRGFRSSGPLADAFGATGATPPWGQEDALNEFARGLGYPFKAKYTQGTTQDLIDNLKNGDPTIVTVVWSGNTQAHALVVAGYDSTSDQWTFLDPLRPNGSEFRTWNTAEFLEVWNRPFLGNVFHNAMVTLYDSP